MQIQEGTPTKEITIKGLVFTVPTPFHEGYVLRANDANVLNQTFAENLRNNFAGDVEEALESAEKAGTEVNVTDLQTSLNVYIGEYDFGVRAAGAGQPKLEPRVRIARDLAKDKVKEAIRKKGLKVSDVDAAKLNELAMGLVERDGWYLEEADRRLAAQRNAAADSIDLGDLGVAAPAAA